MQELSIIQKFLIHNKIDVQQLCCILKLPIKSSIFICLTPGLFWDTPKKLNQKETTRYNI